MTIAELGAEEPRKDARKMSTIPKLNLAGMKANETRSERLDIGEDGGTTYSIDSKYDNTNSWSNREFSEIALSWENTPSQIRECKQERITFRYQ